jgi:uncharacterized protein (TIGR02391 family)
MVERLPVFERIVRRARQFSDARERPIGGLHPFDERNIHSKIPQLVRDLFDDGHYAQATFEAYKFIDNEIQRHSVSKESGFKLMMQVFAFEAPTIKLNPLHTVTETDEQKGFQFIFAGSVLAIRNPRGHKFGIIDSPDKCLDHLSLASMLLRRLDEAGFK